LAPRHGFEPRFTAPKAAVLPLDDRGIVGLCACRQFSVFIRLGASSLALARHLKPDVTPQDLGQQARAKTDQAAAEEMQRAKHRMFDGFDGRRSA
jgi:hypothetical protein